MKKIIVMALILVLCLGVISMAALAAPEGLNSLAIAGAGIPGVDNWDPADANGDMTDTGSSVYTKTLSFAAAGSMDFKVIGNDAWDDNWNFGFATEGEAVFLDQKADLVRGSGSQNIKLTVTEAGDYTITVDLAPLANGGAATILVTKDDKPNPTEPATAPTEPTTSEKEENTDTNRKYILTVEVPDSWTTVFVYTWTDGTPRGEFFGTYPGSALTKKTGNIYECEIDGNITNLIFSNQDTVKTNDLKVRSGCDIKIEIASDATAIIRYPGSIGPLPRPLPIEPDGELSNYRVVGNADWLGNWDAAFEGGRMIKMADGIYRKNFKDVPPGSYEIKITKDGKWGGDIGYNGQNFRFTVFQKGTITVDLNFHGDVGIISVYGPGTWWDEDEDQEQEDNPKSADQPLSLPIALLLFSAAAVPALLSKRKKVR